MVDRIAGDEDQVPRLRAGQIAEAPRIDLDDLPGRLDLHARMNDRRDRLRDQRQRRRRERTAEHQGLQHIYFSVRLGYRKSAYDAHMRRRTPWTRWTVTLLSALGVTLTITPLGGRVWTPPRTAWGDPDLRGVWNYAKIGRASCRERG